MNQRACVALYARVATKRQEKESPIEAQIHALRDRVATEGWQEADLYADDGFSGANLARPALDRLRDDARRGLFTRVLILSPDRLARNYILQLAVEDELLAAGVQVIYCDHARDGTPEGKILERMRGLIAEYEHTNIAERTRRGKLKVAKPLPPGYESPEGEEPFR